MRISDWSSDVCYSDLLEVEADRGESRVEGLGAERVGFAVEFLGEEVELAPHPAAIATADQGPGRLDMGIQPVEFLAHIEAGDMDRQFLRQTVLADRRAQR